MYFFKLGKNIIQDSLNVNNINNTVIHSLTNNDVDI
jgi:hypothetical protein